MKRIGMIAMVLALAALVAAPRPAARASGLMDDIKSKLMEEAKKKAMEEALKKLKEMKDRKKAQEGKDGPDKDRPRISQADAKRLDQFMGDYTGTFRPAQGDIIGGRAKVVVSGEGRSRTYDVVLSAVGLDGEGEPTIEVRLPAKLDGGRLTFAGSADGVDWRGQTDGETLTAEAPGDRGGKLNLRYAVRRSPTEGAGPPDGAVVLLPFEEGKRPSLDEWTNKDWDAQPDGSIAPRKGDTCTRRQFGSFRLHLEFMCPFMPGKAGQDRAHSGVFLHDRYEVQVLDSYGLKSRDDDCAAIFKLAAPRVNACLPPGSWQTYDITFLAARFDEAGKLERNPIVIVVHNGVVVHENVEIPVPAGGTHAKAGPIRLQDAGQPVRFRNVWVEPMKD